MAEIDVPLGSCREGGDTDRGLEILRSHGRLASVQVDRQTLFVLFLFWILGLHPRVSVRGAHLEGSPRSHRD